jgi:hypothetical protein
MDPATIISFLGIPTAAYGFVKGSADLWGLGRNIYLRRVTSEDFTILRTATKYIIWQDQCELIRLRHIRALRPVRQLQIDRYPRVGDIGDEKRRPVTDFYSLPGTARQRQEFFVIDLRPDEEFKPNKEHSIIFGYTIPGPLSITNPGEREEGIDLMAPLGRDKASLEVHLPPTHRFGDENKVHVYAYFGGNGEGTLQAKDQYRLTIDRDFINTHKSSPCDVLRFSIRPPKGAQEIRIRWPWEKRVE